MATASASAQVPEALIRKIGALSRERVAEVEHFVDFIGQREIDATARTLSDMARDGSGPTFAKVWDNPEDSAYDAL